MLVKAEDSVQHLFESIRQLRCHTNLDIYIRDFYNEEFWGYEVDLRVADDRTAPELFLNKDRIDQMGMISSINEMGYPNITKGRPELLLKLDKLSESSSEFQGIEPEKSVDFKNPEKPEEKKVS